MASGGPSKEIKRRNAYLDKSHLLEEDSLDIIKSFALVFVVSVIVWAICSSIRLAVGHATEHLNESTVWIVCLTLIVGGCLRGLLLKLPSFKDTEGDGVPDALTWLQQGADIDGEADVD